MANKIENHKAEADHVFENTYPLPTLIICENPRIKKYVSQLNKFIRNEMENEKYNKQADFDIGLVDIVSKMFEDFYSKGIKDMDKMHRIIDKEIKSK